MLKVSLRRLAVVSIFLYPFCGVAEPRFVGYPQWQRMELSQKDGIVRENLDSYLNPGITYTMKYFKILNTAIQICDSNRLLIPSVLRERVDEVFRDHPRTRRIPVAAIITYVLLEKCETEMDAAADGEGHDRLSASALLSAMERVPD